MSAKGFRFGIVVSKYNEFVTSRLLSGATDVLLEAGAKKDAITVVHVPGTFEIPLVAQRLAKSGKFDAVICLGAVIRGETPHYEYISAETSRGIGHASLESGVPIMFGVLTTETGKQALERASEPERNRGSEAARSAVEMASLMRQLNGANRKAARSASVKTRHPAKKSKSR